MNTNSINQDLKFYLMYFWQIQIKKKKFHQRQMQVAELLVSELIEMAVFKSFRVNLDPYLSFLFFKIL